MEPVCKEITINEKSLVSEIQRAFNLLYPYLKIEFFKSRKEISESRRETVEPSINFRQVSPRFLTKKLNLANERTIAEVQNEIHSMFGLQIKVFRKSGKVWNVISLTDSWTLESQNSAGEFISNEMSDL